MSKTEMMALREMFRANTAQLHARMNRVPIVPEYTGPKLDEATREQLQLNKWTRTMLAVFINRNWSKLFRDCIKTYSLTDLLSARLSSASAKTPD